MREASVARIMVAGTASGCGKTTLTCGLLRLLTRLGLRVQACKSGPDYLDPTFHTRVLGVPSRNLDLFLGGEGLVRTLLAEGGSADVIVIEGAMGFYDGIATSDEASSYALARETQTPVVLVVDARGRALSTAAEVAGFVRFRNPSQMAGVILNRVSPAYYPQLKRAVERETGVAVLGYVPRLEGALLESRHLGLVDAAEVADLQQRVDVVADALEQSLNVDALLTLAKTAPPLSYEPLPVFAPHKDAPIIAVARDEAFSFYYHDCIELLKRLGARIAYFSPLHDERLPEGACGLYLGGGYPELHARALGENAAMRGSIRAAIASGMPTIAECGGFLYLHETLEDSSGTAWPVAGVLTGRAVKGERLGRFGYVTLTAQRDGLLARQGEELPAHEFHYWQTTRDDAAFHAQKPQSMRGWDCGVESSTLYAAFPHLYLPGCPHAAVRFVDACAAFAAGEGGDA